MAKMIMPIGAFQFVCDGDRAGLLHPQLGTLIFEHAALRNLSVNVLADIHEVPYIGGKIHRMRGLQSSEVSIDIVAGMVTMGAGQNLIDFNLVRNMTVRQLLTEIDRRLKKR